MRLQIGVGAARREQALIGEALEGVVHALRRLAGGAEELHAGAVGVLLLLPLIGQQRAADDLARARQRGGPGIGQAAVASATGADGERAGTENRGDDHLGLGRRELLAQLGEVAAGEMAGLVGEHADQLVRIFRLHDRAVIDEDAAAVRDERVEGCVVDDDHLDVLLLKASGTQDRPRIFTEQHLGLGVAQDRRSLALLRRGRLERCQRDGKRDERGESTGQSLMERDTERHQAIFAIGARLDKGYCPPNCGMRLICGERCPRRRLVPAQRAGPNSRVNSRYRWWTRQ